MSPSSFEIYSPATVKQHYGKRHSWQHSESPNPELEVVVAHTTDVDNNTQKKRTDTQARPMDYPLDPEKSINQTRTTVPRRPTRLEAIMKHFIKSMSKEEKQKMMREFMDNMADEEKTEMMKLMMPIMVENMKPAIMANMMSTMMEHFNLEDCEKMMTEMPKETKEKFKTMMTNCLTAIEKTNKTQS